MNKTLQRFVSFLIALVLVCSYPIAVFAITPGDTTRLAPVIPMSALRYFDHYYCEELDDTVFPDYYAGMKLNSDSTVTIFVTSMAPDILSTIIGICEDDSIQFSLVPYSFNELLALQHTLLNKYKTDMNISHSSISIEDNAVVVYVEEDISNVSLRLDDFSIDSEPIIILPSVKTAEESNSSKTDDSSKVDLSPLNGSIVYSGTTFKSGIVSYRRPTGGSGYTSVMGTISFVALDASGNKVIITHGHDVEDYGSTLKVQNTVLGFNVVGIGDYNDFSYAILPSNAVLNNSIASTGYSLSGTMTLSSFMSISNPATYFYGHTSGSVYASSYRAESDGVDYFLYSESGVFSLGGDSGGPIFVSTANGNKLVGIVKRGDGESYSQGVFLSYIKDLYYDDTGSTLYVFVNSTPYS